PLLASEGSRDHRASQSRCEGGSGLPGGALWPPERPSRGRAGGAGAPLRERSGPLVERGGSNRLAEGKAQEPPLGRSQGGIGGRAARGSVYLWVGRRVSSGRDLASGLPSRELFSLLRGRGLLVSSAKGRAQDRRGSAGPRLAPGRGLGRGARALHRLLSSAE